MLLATLTMRLSSIDGTSVGGPMASTPVCPRAPPCPPACPQVSRRPFVSTKTL